MNENKLCDNSFNKDKFKGIVADILRKFFLAEIETASQDQLYKAVCAAVMDVIAANWMKTKKAVREQDCKTVYYMSMEFLVGRALGNNLINLGAEAKVREALKELGVNLNTLEDQEPEPALGNGGLGRLGVCSLDSLTTLGYSATGCGIRYHHGLFRQVILDGYQHEVPDDWLDEGYPFEIRHPEEARVVRFGGQVETFYNVREEKVEYVQKGCSEILAVPYEMPIVGYDNGIVNTLRLWDAEALTSDDLEYDTILEERRLAEQLSGVLYPDDSTDEGKKLRLKQQYFFVSASVQSAVAEYKKSHDDLTKLPEKVCFQLNDTHPAVTVAELMRVLIDEEGLGWEEAWEVTTKCVAFTNHSVMCEVLEEWPVEIFAFLLPRIFQIVAEIDRRFVNEIERYYPDDRGRFSRLAIIYDGRIRMANLSIVASFSVNGVAALHTHILENELFRDFYEMMPCKFNNKTNGVTHRRFLLHGNPVLAGWVTGYIGRSWITDFSQIRKMAVYADSGKAQREFMQIRYYNKKRLADYIRKNNGVEVDPASIFDIQAKRCHMYKRQLLLVLYIIYRYNQIRQHPEQSDFCSRTFIFGAKAASSYHMAKLVIKLINSVAEVINHDPSVNGKIKVVFIENYCVSNAELIFSAADVSEQISCYGTEASGTGNMKMQMAGAVTCGTMDGANVEIVEETGLENEFIFGLPADEIKSYRQNGGYDPKAIFHADGEIRQVLTQLVDGTFSPDPELFRDIYESLLNGSNGEAPDRFFVLADFRSYIEAQKRIDEAYRDRSRWAKMSILNMACSSKFSSDRTAQEYVDDIWKLEKIKPEPIF